MTRLPAARSLAGLVGVPRQACGVATACASGGSRSRSPMLTIRDGEVFQRSRPAVCGSGIRYFGVMDTIQDRLQQRNVNQQEKEFKKQMMELSELEKFDLDDFAKIIAEPLEKWTAKMPWNSGREELVNMQKQKKVLDAMTPGQRSDPSSIRERHKKAIIDRADCSIEELHEVLYRFREMRGMHLWLRERRERNQKIPENTEDMGPMIADTEGVPLTKFMKKKRSRSGMRMSRSF